MRSLSERSFQMNPLKEDLERWAGWGRKLLVCNPFYLASAIVLLSGIYLFWQDRVGISESEHLQMNFLTLQGYELLLVGTAILLARRKIWYDATLLTGIESVFIFIPFILLSQATWMAGSAGVWNTAILATGGALLAAGKFAALRRWFRELLLPGRLLWLGGALLAIHLSLPLAFKAIHLLTAAGAPRDGALQLALVLGWSVLLPVLVGMFNLLERPRRHDDMLCRQWWLPWWFLGIWAGSVGYHLWALMYVYDVPGSNAWVVPALWAASWTLYHRRVWFFGRLQRWQELVMLALPLAVFAGVGARDLSWQLIACTLANAGLYGWLAFRRRRRVVLAVLAMVSLSGVVAFLPVSMLAMGRAESMAGALLVLLVLLAVATRSATMGLIGGTCVVAMLNRLFGELGVPGDLALQLGAAFVLIHSLRWRLPAGWQSETVRGLIALGWLVGTLKWLHFDGTWHSMAGTTLTALLVLLCYTWRRLATGDRSARMVIRAAVGVLAFQPLYPVFDMIVEAGPTMMTIAAAFILFGLGTALAWNREAWLGDKEEDGSLTEALTRETA